MSCDETPEHRYMAATAALERGELETARRHFEILTLDHPRFAPAWDGLGQCHLRGSDPARAESCFRRAVRLDRGNWRSRLNWGRALHGAGDPRAALRWLRAAVRIAPGERALHLAEGLCCCDLGQYDAALACFRRALRQPEREVRDAELHLHVGNAELERGDGAAAERAFELACLLSPDEGRIYYHWAVACARQGRLEEAGRLAARAQALEPGGLRAPLLRFHVALDGGDWSGAEARIAGLAENGRHPRLAAALRAELERRRGRPAAARARALEALAGDLPSCSHALELALGTLRELRARRAVCRGYRFLFEVLSGGQAYFRPFLVQAESEEEALAIAVELQEELDPAPWRVVEAEVVLQRGEALVGVCHLVPGRVLFPREDPGDLIGFRMPGEGPPQGPRGAARRGGSRA